MSGSLESLDELAAEVQDAYEEARQLAEQSGPRGAESIRDLVDAGERPTTKVDMLDAWQLLMKSLYEHQVFLQYSPLLEKLFYQITSYLEESEYDHVKTLLEYMTQAVEHEEESQALAAECRYVTLLEILATFVSNWELSSKCQRVWETTMLGLDGGDDGIHETIATASSAPPEEFRKTAYGVLMSLQWVPNAPGLREICGFDDGDASQLQIPVVVQSIFLQIRSTPLPRHDGIHQLLNRLLQQGHASVAIASLEDDFGSRESGVSQGLGKTTLAAMVTAHPLVQADFCVLWLRLNHHSKVGSNATSGTGLEPPESESLTYSQYVEYLDSLCGQLGIEHSWPQPVRSLEEKSLRSKREEERMYQVKREMSLLLEHHATNKNLLMVLDDVKDDQEIEWFWFKGDQSSLVTTLSQSLSVDWTLDLEMLSEDEALELFLTEADYPPSHVLSTSLEAKSIVHRCGYHPLTIRTVARWFRLKQVTAGVVKGLEELNHELSSCMAKLRHTARSSNNVIHPSQILAEVMNLMLSPVLAAGGQPTTLMKMCLSSMAIVFGNSRKAVPTEAVHLLWGQLLRTEPDAIHELGDSLTHNQLRKRVRFISEALSSLGMLSTTTRSSEENGEAGIAYVEIHHEMQAVYAVNSCREMHFSASPAETVRRWHEAFASAYLAKKVESDRDGIEDKCRAYALEHLLYHMLSASMYQKVAVLLRDERFLGERLSFLGWDKGIATHIKDCYHYRDAMELDETIDADPVDVVAAILVKVGAFVADYAEEASDATEAATALHLIGYALADMGRYSDATAQYKIALKMVPKTSSLAGTILYSLSTVYMARHDHDKGLKNLKECLKVMNESGETNALYSEALMLKADALMTHCDYRGAAEFYDFALEKLFANSANNRVEIGIALGRKARLYQVMGELDNAYNSFDECVKWKEKMDESSCDLASIFNYMGDICVERGDQKEALQFFDRAYRMFEFHRPEAEETDIHIINGKTDALHDDAEGCIENFMLALESMRTSQRTMFERTAYDLRIIARTYMDSGNEAKALLAFNDCLKQTNENAEISLERSKALFDMGTMHLSMKQMDLALQCFQQSLKIRIVKLGESSTVISTLLKIGYLHRDIGQLDEALSFVNKALELTERVYGESDDRVGDVLFAVADIKLNLNENVEALAMFGECLEFRRRQHTRPNPQIAAALEGLGKVHIKNGTYDKSYQCLAEALDIRQATMEPDHPDIASTFYFIGMVARKGGDCERALHFLLDSLHIRKSLKDQGDTVMTLSEIGHVHRQLHDDISALGCYEKCVEILKESYGPSDVRLVDIYLPLGHVKKQQGVMEESKEGHSGKKLLDAAKEYYEKALKIAKKLLGDDHIKTGAAFRSLGLLQYEAKNYDEALEYLGTFIKIQDSNKVKNTADYVLALQLIGDINRYNGRNDEASSAFASANHAFSHSKEVAKKYSGFQQILERRLSEENDSNIPPPPTGLFARITGELGRLGEEVKTSAGGIKNAPDEVELRNSILLDD
jgi:tetratricopeptide (TPR) repeat protein